MKKVLYFILFLNATYIAAQSGSPSWIDDKPVTLLPSPQSQLFEQYLNHEIAEYNGLPEISIPLYEIEVKGLKIPVSLNYHASGIKYKQFDGDVGAGWSLSIGGYRVCRTIHGFPDELFTRLSLEQYFEKVDLFNQGNNIICADINQNFFSRTAGLPMYRNADSEYDQFSYMLPGTSGHFFLGGNLKKPVVYEANKDSIKLGGIEANSGFTDMTIIDNAGFKYFLGGNGYVEKSEVISIGSNCFYSVGWPLRLIETPYNENINFYYNYSKKTIYPDNDPLNGAYVVWGDHSGGDPIYRAEDGAGSPYAGSIIKPSISLPSQEFDNYMFFLNLLTVNNTDSIIITRNGASNYTYAISSIKIISNGQLIKEISFEYDTPNSTSWHLLLNKVKIGNNSNVFQEYSFSYYPGPIAYSQMPLPDQYGFYGSSWVYNNSNNWQTAFLHQNFVDEMIYDAYSSYLKIGDGPFAKFYDKGFTNVANYYMLKQITFPTKGYTEYEYDADSWHSRPRVKRITSKTDDNSNPLVTEYSYENPVNNISGEHFGPYTFSNYFGDEYVDAYVVAVQLLPWPVYDLHCRKVAQYFPNPILPEISEYARQYERVIKKQYDINGDTIGKTVSEYNIPQIYHIDNFSSKAISPNESDIPGFSKYGDYYTNRYRLGYKPAIKSQKFYDSAGLKKEVEYYYVQRGNEADSSFKVKQRVVVVSSSYEHISRFSHGLYYMETGSDFLSSKITTTYSDNGGAIQEKEYYIYNNYHQLIKTEHLSSTGSFLTKVFNYTNEHHPIWESMNILSTVMKTVTSNKEANGTTKELETLWVKYPTVLSTQPSLLLPDSVVSIINGNQRTLLTYDKYNQKEKILQYTGSDGVTVTYIWGYGNKYPVAEIRNETYQNVLTALGGNTVVDRIADSLILSDPDKLIINSLRNALPNSLITTYTYKPGVGILTSTDPKGMITSYEYDQFGRLQSIKDHNGNIIEQYDYNYKN